MYKYSGINIEVFLEEAFDLNIKLTKVIIDGNLI